MCHPQLSLARLPASADDGRGTPVTDLGTSKFQGRHLLKAKNMNLHREQATESKPHGTMP
jgi:hypothetical protein